MNFFGRPTPSSEFLQDETDDSTITYPNVFALDQLKQSGLPIKNQILPYLQVYTKLKTQLLISCYFKRNLFRSIHQFLNPLNHNI